MKNKTKQRIQLGKKQNKTKNKIILLLRIYFSFPPFSHQPHRENRKRGKKIRAAMVYVNDYAPQIENPKRCRVRSRGWDRQIAITRLASTKCRQALQKERDNQMAEGGEKAGRWKREGRKKKEGRESREIRLRGRDRGRAGRLERWGRRDKQWGGLVEEKEKWKIE